LIQQYENSPENSTLRKEAAYKAKENEKVAEKIRMKTVVAYLKQYGITYDEKASLETLEGKMKSHQNEKAIAALNSL